MGIVVTADAEPLDAFDRDYLEGEIAGYVSMIHGVRAEHGDGRLVVRMAAGAELSPALVGEALVAGLRHEFPRIGRVAAEVIFDPVRLKEMLPGVRAELAARAREMDEATEESIPRIVTCTGCSPFAPDHVCIVTHESPPQCGRPYGMIKTGALYGLDDMSDIHHRALHAGINSFGTTEKGELLDAVAGEWSGVNAAASRLTGGRTTRIQLHRVDIAPRTGCGCFGFIIFTVGSPASGIGVMDRGWKGRAPDGRSWWDLHYALAGKQAPGLMGASEGYLLSRRFLAAHGGWKDVVWVSPRVAEVARGRVPAGATVG
jgi:acetyl-CoA decarbonylase/synthase complex subunit beta